MNKLHKEQRYERRPKANWQPAAQFKIPPPQYNAGFAKNASGGRRDSDLIGNSTAFIFGNMAKFPPACPKHFCPSLKSENVIREHPKAGKKCRFSAKEAAVLQATQLMLVSQYQEI